MIPVSAELHLAFPWVLEKIKIKFIENKNTFEENEWQELYKLSEGTFVEETEQLKNSAAGAGLTDND